MSVKQLHMRSNQFTHAKLVIDRGREALLLGSPMEQDYYDGLQHAVDEPRRGKSAKKGPIHDVSVGVRGPAVGHMQELFNNHWNLAASDDKLPVEAPTLPAIGQTDDTKEFITAVQFVRTLDAMFTEDFDPPAPNGEQGVLEAYLRAIHFAERFIYIENQYFNNDTITHALIDALAAKPKLVVILFLNSAPDMPLYLAWQQKAIDQIAGLAQGCGGEGALRRVQRVESREVETPSIQSRASSTTTCTRSPPSSTTAGRRWARRTWTAHRSIRSSTRDRSSVATSATPKAISSCSRRSPPSASAVDALRRRLWSEHLGIVDPDIDRARRCARQELARRVAREAQRKLDGLKTNLDQVLAFDGPRTDGIQSHVLPWPTELDVLRQARLPRALEPAQRGARAPFDRC